MAKIPVTKKVPGTTFPKACLQFLRNCLYENPSLGHAIIERLMCKGNKEFLANNQTLQGLFLKCIEGSLNSVIQNGEGMQTGVLENENLQQYQDLIYNLLSLMNPTSEMTELELDRVFLRLLELKGADPSFALFDSKKIYSCLLGRKTNYLIMQFQRVEEYMRKNQPKQLYVRSLSNGNEEHNEVLTFKKANKEEKWRYLFFETLYNNQHMLENVLVSIRWSGHVTCIVTSCIV